MKNFLLSIVLVSIILSSQSAYAAVQEKPPLVDALWLYNNINSSNIVVLDVRKQTAYEAGHIPKAIHTDYNNWRVSRNNLPGYLPEESVIEAIIQELGIDGTTHVIVVSGVDQSGDFGTAARIYWTLKVSGLNNLSVLDGGQAAWVAAGYRTTTDSPTPKKSNYKIAKYDASLLATQDNVVKSLKDKLFTFLDARPKPQYDGFEKHPAAKNGGTIQGSVNISQFDFINANGTLKSKDQLQALADKKNISKTNKVVSFCNTGHWAATDWFVMSEILGYQAVLYDGSMVDYTSNKKNPLDNVRSKKELQKYNKNKS